MGMCQGRMCGTSVAELISSVVGETPDKIPLHHAQLPLFPLRIQELIGSEIPPDSTNPRYFDSAEA